MPAALLLSLVLGVGGFAATEMAAGPAGDLLGSARVREGDTLVVSGTPVRLQGLHCPELSKAGGAKPVPCLAVWSPASRFAARSTASGSVIGSSGAATWTGQTSRPR